MLASLLNTGINALSAANTIANVSKLVNVAVDAADRKYNLYYPLSLTGISQLESTDSTLKLTRPTIIFTCNSRSVGLPTKIAFPIPQGLEFSDGASYDDTALGFVASSLIEAANTVSDLAQSGGNVDKITRSIDALKQNFAPITLDSALFGGANLIGGMSDTFKSAVGVAMKMTMNRHVTTEFTGVGTRTYGFKFKMIGSSRQESDMIRDISNAFRDGLYPEGDALALKYPPTWTIRFMLNNTDIAYVPKIWECYLQSVNVSYNGSAALWHDDGSPIECDITVSFKETRALTHKDIQDLKTDPFINIKNQNKRDLPKKDINAAVQQRKEDRAETRRQDRQRRGI